DGVDAEADALPPGVRGTARAQRRDRRRGDLAPADLAGGLDEASGQARRRTSRSGGEAAPRRPRGVLRLRWSAPGRTAVLRRWEGRREPPVPHRHPREPPPTHT